MERLLEELNDKYLNKVIKNEENKKLLEELENLRGNKYVKRYLELIKLEKEIPIYEDDYLLNMTFNKRRENVLFGCNIYVYFGAYVDRGSNIYLDGSLTHNIYNSDFLLYKELLDVSNNNMISYDECESFCSDKVIIRFNDDKFYNREHYEKCYNHLRAFYCKGLLDGKSNDEILKMIESDKDKFNIYSISYVLTIDGKVRRKIK